MLSSLLYSNEISFYDVKDSDDQSTEISFLLNKVSFIKSYSLINPSRIVIDVYQSDLKKDILSFKINSKKASPRFPARRGKVGPSVQRRERARAGMTRHSRLRERLDGVLVEVGHGDTRGELRIDGRHGQRWGRNTRWYRTGFSG